MQTRFIRRRGFGRRFGARKRRWQWVRTTQNNAAPAATNFNDLFATWRTTANFSITFPEFTIWRIHIKVSVLLHLSPATVTSSDGALIALYTENMDLAVQENPVTHPYNYQYLMWDQLYNAEQQVFSHAGTTSPLMVYRQYDIRARRKIPNVMESLWLSINSTGNAVLDNYSFTASILTKLP